MKYIFLHGLGQDSSSWDIIIQELNIRSDDILYPNLSDWFENKKPSYKTLYDELENYCNEFHEPICLCGLSLGGILALQYTIEHPNQIHSLVLIGTQYSMPKILLKIQNIIFHIIPNSNFNKMGFKKTDFIQLCKSMIDLNFTHNLKEINCPTLIICGEKDKANKTASIQLQKTLTNAKLKIIKNAGHEVNIDKPLELAHVIKKFIDC